MTLCIHCLYESLAFKPCLCEPLPLDSKGIPRHKGTCAGASSTAAQIAAQAKAQALVANASKRAKWDSK